MASRAYRAWVAAGRSWRLARPIAELDVWARAHGVAVLGTIGNEDHLTADPPEDHTPFSATAWPKPLPGYVVTAIDLANVRGLGEAIELQARAGRLPWLKYMNHAGQHLDSRDLDGDGRAWEEYDSSDEHVHLSIRSDWIDRTIGTFDPWQQGAPMTDDYGRYGRPPHGVADRTTAVMIADLWWQELAGVSPYDGRSASSRTAQLARLEQMGAADAERDTATRAAIETLTELLRAGGGDVDTAAILARIDERAATVTAVVARLQEALAASEADRAALAARLADAYDGDTPAG